MNDVEFISKTSSLVDNWEVDIMCHGEVKSTLHILVPYNSTFSQISGRTDSSFFYY